MVFFFFWVSRAFLVIRQLLNPMHKWCLKRRPFAIAVSFLHGSTLYNRDVMYTIDMRQPQTFSSTTEERRMWVKQWLMAWPLSQSEWGPTAISFDVAEIIFRNLAFHKAPGVTIHRRRERVRCIPQQLREPVKNRPSKQAAPARILRAKTHRKG